MRDRLLPRKIKEMQPYEPNEAACEVKLDANESGISLPGRLRERLASIAQSLDFNRYPDPSAADVCRAFADFWGIDPSLVVAGNGSDELISVVVNAFLEKGNKAMVLLPDFSMYAFYCGIAEIPCIRYQKDENDNFNIDDALSVARREGVKLIAFSNPCNPTGKGINADEARQLVRNFEGIVLLDEAYMDFWDQSLLPEIAQYDNLIILRTCSKAFGLAALRLGFAVSNPRFAAALKAAKSPYNVNSLTQAMAVELLKEKAYLRECTKRIIESRDQLYNELIALSGSCPGRFKTRKSVTNFVVIDMQGADKVFQKLLAKGISVRCLSETRLRVTAGQSGENRAFLSAFEEIIGRRG